MAIRTGEHAYLCALVALVAAAQEPSFFLISQQPADYPEPKKTLEVLVRADAKKEVNHFCVVGYQDLSRDKRKYAWVWWKENNSLVLWDAGIKPRYASSALKNSHRFLHLSRDVVGTEAELHGSTYLVTKDWVAQTERDCEEHGEKFVISKPRR